MPTLNWIGKSAVVDHHNQVPFHLLRCEPALSAGEAQSGNLLVDRLTPALLAKAFRGELVPQDPNDEPASALLERIREARALNTASKSSDKVIEVQDDRV